MDKTNGIKRVVADLVILTCQKNYAKQISDWRKSNDLETCSRERDSYNLQKPQQVYFGHHWLSIKTC